MADDSDYRRAQGLAADLRGNFYDGNPAVYHTVYDNFQRFIQNQRVFFGRRLDYACHLGVYGRGTAQD